MNITYRQSYYDINFNTNCSISFNPIRNDKTEPSVIVDVPDNSFVINSIQFLNWPNDMEIGQSNPQQVTLSLKLDAIENDSTIDPAYKTYLFESLLNPYIDVERTLQIENDNFGNDQIINIKSYDSNSITIIIQYSTPIFLYLKQDVYTTLNPHIVNQSTKYVTDVDISCIDRYSFYLKVTPPNILQYTLKRIEDTGTKGVDWDSSKFAFDYHCNIEGMWDDYEKYSNGEIYDDPNVTRWFKRQTQLSTIISGQPAKNGSYIDDSDNNRVLDNMVTRGIPVQNQYNVFYSYPARYSIQDNCFYEYQTSRDNIQNQNYFDMWEQYLSGYSDQTWNKGNGGRNISHNGYSELFFLNINSLNQYINNTIYEFTGLSFFNETTINIDFLYKQYYEGSINTHGNLIEPNNTWILYKVQGAGDINQTLNKDSSNNVRSVTSTFVNNERYRTNKQFTEALAGSYSSLFDLQNDIMLGSLGSNILTSDGILSLNRTSVIDVDFTFEPIDVNIEFGYMSINIQTGSVDPQTSDSTTSVVVSPGSAININIPQFFNTYPIDPKNSINHTFIPIVYTGDDTTNAVDLPHSVYALYLSDTQTNNQTYNNIDVTPIQNNRTGVDNPMFENWGNAGFYYNQQVPDPVNAPSTSQNVNRKWNYWNSYSQPYITFNPDNIRGHDVREPENREVLSTRLRRRPVQCLHLNDVNWSPFKVWYREQYSEMAWPQGGFMATYPDRYTFVAANPMFDYIYDDDSNNAFSMTKFDWRIRQNGEEPGSNYKDDDPVFLTERDNLLIDTIVTQNLTREKLVMNLKKYRDMCMYSFDQYWANMIKEKLAGAVDEYIRTNIVITLKPNIFRRLFIESYQGDSDLYHYLITDNYFRFNITSNPYQQQLNNIYKCIGWDFDGSDYIIKFQMISQKELGDING